MVGADGPGPVLKCYFAPGVSATQDKISRDAPSKSLSLTSKSLAFTHVQKSVRGELKDTLQAMRGKSTQNWSDFSLFTQGIFSLTPFPWG